jgi:hypothetical protein
MHCDVAPAALPSYAGAAAAAAAEQHAEGRYDNIVHMFWFHVGGELCCCCSCCCFTAAVATSCIAAIPSLSNPVCVPRVVAAPNMPQRSCCCDAVLRCCLAQRCAALLLHSYGLLHVAVWWRALTFLHFHNSEVMWKLLTACTHPL